MYLRKAPYDLDERFYTEIIVSKSEFKILIKYVAVVRISCCNWVNLNDNINIKNNSEVVMRSTGLLLLLVLSVSFVFLGCKQGEEVVDKSEEMHQEAEMKFDASMPDKVAPEVWELIQTEDYKLKWENWPGKENIYVNPVAFEAIQKDEAEFPIGTIIVREKFSAEGNLDKINVASRIGGNEQTEGWFAADYAPDGEVIKVNKNVINIRP